MNPEQRELARHALGLPNSRRRSYRNRYYAPPAGHAFLEWRGLVALGFAVQGSEGGRSVLFYLTREGAERALMRGEILDPEDFEHD